MEDVQEVSKWQEIDRETDVDESMHQGFVCIVPEALKHLFQANYKSFGPTSSEIAAVPGQKSNKFSYG